MIVCFVNGHHHYQVSYTQLNFISEISSDKPNNLYVNIAIYFPHENIHLLSKLFQN